jgi:eukaryotic-like serine/threonine-protein kinase
VFAGYTVEGQIGSGATGVVWLATQVEIDRKVAIKQLAPALASDETFRAQFRTEARLLASLSHPNVVTVFDYVEDGENAPYIVEEWVEGAALDRVVATAGRLTAEQAVGVLRGALTGLVAAHAAGVVHGDVSATNILVDAEGTSKLVDFGLASPSGDASSSGTPAYASPEAVSGLPLDARSDVYSAGCVLFELIAGTPPYRADSLDALAAQHVSAPVPTLPAVNRQVSEVVARAMAKEPDDRYPDAAAFLAALEESAEHDLGAAWLAGASLVGAVLATTAAAAAGAGGGASSSVAATSATGRSSNVARFASRRRVPLAIGGAAVVVVVVAVAALAGGGGSKKQVAPNSGIDPAKAAAIRRGQQQSASTAPLRGVLVGLETRPGLPMTINTSSYSGRVRQEATNQEKLISFNCGATGCQAYEGSAGGRVVGDRAHFSQKSQNSGCTLTTTVVDLRITSWTTRSGVRVPVEVTGSVDSTWPEGPTPACGGGHYHYEGTARVVTREFP